MTVIHQTGWQPKPGRDQEFIQAIPQARALHTRLGARVRVWRAIVAGPNSGRIGYGLEFDSHSAFAKFSAALQGDADWMALVPKYWGPESPATSLGNSIFTTLSGLDDPASASPGGPRVRTLRQFNVEKGGLAAARVILGEYRAHMLRLGALRFRAVQSLYAGPGPTILAVASEYADLASYGAVLDAGTADEAIQAFFATRLGVAGSPLTAAGSALQVELS